MKKILPLFVFCSLPLFASAGVSFSEIMYDLEGGDTDREWVEVFNEGSESVDLSAWKLFEGESNHKLTFYRGDALLKAGGYAVIATKPEAFLKDWPSFAGTLFGSSFSLKNTGEEIILRDSALKDSDKVAYTPDWGAKGDGNSLQKVKGKWVAWGPTPGAPSVVETVQEKKTSTTTSNLSAVTVTSTQESSSASPSITAKESSLHPSLSATMIVNPVVVVGADVLFRGEGSGLLGKPLQGARYLWNFGDGSSQEGASVLHVYRHPGVYVAVLEVVSGEFLASARVNITVAVAEVSISSVSPGERGFIEMFNKGSRELDLSSWQLKVDDSFFMFPKNTFILSGEKIVFGNETTGLPVKENSTVSLLYPNGDSAYRYEGTVEKPDSPSALEEKASLAAVSEVNLAGLSSSSAGPSHSLQKKTERPQSGVSSRPVSFYSVEGVTEKATDAPVSGVPGEEAAAGDTSASAASSSRGVPHAWLLGVAGMVLLSATAVVAVRKQSADDITIIE